MVICSYGKHKARLGCMRPSHEGMSWAGNVIASSDLFSEKYMRFLEHVIYLEYTTNESLEVKKPTVAVSALMCFQNS